MPLVARGHQHILPSQAFWKEKNMTNAKSFFFLKKHTTIWKKQLAIGSNKTQALEMFGTKLRERGICNYPRLPASVSATALPTLNSWEINQKHRFLAAALSWGSRADTPDVIKTKPRWEAAAIETSACPEGAMLSLHWSCDSEPHLYGASFSGAPHHWEFTHSCSSFRKEAEYKEPCLTTFLILTVLNNVFMRCSILKYHLELKYFKLLCSHYLIFYVHKALPSS